MNAHNKTIYVPSTSVSVQLIGVAGAPNIKCGKSNISSPVMRNIKIPYPINWDEIAFAVILFLVIIFFYMCRAFGFAEKQTVGRPEVGALSIRAVSMTAAYTMLPGLWLFPH